VEAAIEATGLGTLGLGNVDNLFIIAEPEAAATYLVGSSHNMLVRQSGHSHSKINSFFRQKKRSLSSLRKWDCGWRNIHPNKRIPPAFEG
jgi:hypothetical protein